MKKTNLVKAKEQMLKEHFEARGIFNPHILAAFREVPREVFVQDEKHDLAYADMPLEIGNKQTISQPYTVAFMTQLLDPKPSDVVLEVGTGSGYQAAILSRLVKRVYTIERFEGLGNKAREVLRQLGYKNVEVIIGDGTLGLPKKAPFDGIIVTAGAPKIPEPLIEQLKVGGRLVIPVGEPWPVGQLRPAWLEMVKIIKMDSTGSPSRKTRVAISDRVQALRKETFPGFNFVPLVGKYGSA